MSSSQETIFAQLVDNGGDNDIKHDTHPHTLLLLRKDHPFRAPNHKKEEGRKRKEGTGKMSRGGLVGELCL